MFWCKRNVNKVSYQRPEIRVYQDVAIVCDGKYISMDP